MTLIARRSDLRIQRTQMVRNLFRQHGQDAIREVNRRAAYSGLAVHGRARLNEVRDVGDVDSQLKAAVGQHIHIDGVVEVSGRRRVDSDRVAISEIVPAFQVALANRVRQAGCFFFHFFRKLRRQTELLDDHLRLDIRIVDESNDADDLARRPVSRRWESGDFDFNDPSLCSDRASGMRIFSGNFSSVGVTKKTWPSNRNCPTTVSRARLITLNDASFGSPARLSIGDFHLYLVAVHGRARQRCRYEDVAVQAGDLL